MIERSARGCCWSSEETFSPWRHLSNSAAMPASVCFRRMFLSRSFSYLRFHSSAVNSSFTVTTFLIVFVLKRYGLELLETDFKPGGFREFLLIRTIIILQAKNAHTEQNFMLSIIKSELPNLDINYSDIIQITKLIHFRFSRHKMHK